MSIADIIHMLQGSFDGMVDYAAAHNLPEPVSFGKVGDKVVMRLVDDNGTEYVADLYVGLRVAS